MEDEEEIVISLLEQLKDFGQYLGGAEHEKCLIPLLIAFCKIDERIPAEKAVEQMIPILNKNHDIILDTVKKLAKPEMVISKDCSARIIAAQIGNVSSNEVGPMLETYNTIVVHENPSVRKTGARHLKVFF